MTEVRGFVSHAFDDAFYEGGTKAFRQKIKELVASACADFASERVEVTHDLFFEAMEYGTPLMRGVRDQIRGSDFLIADITQLGGKPVNPNVMYEIGYAMALDKRIVVIRSNATPAPPTDIGDLLAGTYERVEEIPEVFRDTMIRVVTETLAKANRETNRIEPLVNKVWFPADTRSINIVCSREPEPSRFSDRREANYVRIDKFEDRDALIELATFFARRYPYTQVVRHLCDELPDETLNGDLVILGGPGCVVGEGNTIARELMEQLGSNVSYPESGEGLVWGTEPIRPTQFAEDESVKEDWGSILAAPNPNNPTARVVLLHGTHTFGTLGAAVALIDTATAIGNHLKLATLELEDRLTLRFNFEALVRVEVGQNGRVKPPRLEFDKIRRIET